MPIKQLSQICSLLDPYSRYLVICGTDKKGPRGPGGNACLGRDSLFFPVRLKDPPRYKEKNNRAYRGLQKLLPELETAGPGGVY